MQEKGSHPSQTSNKKGPTLGPDSPLPMTEQLRYWTIQFSLSQLSHVNVQTALTHQLRLLEDGTMFRAVLDEMIAEQRPQPVSHEEDDCYICKGKRNPTKEEVINHLTAQPADFIFPETIEREAD